MNDTTTLTMPSARELVITHEFNAPRKLVYEALTQPEHAKHWYGPRVMTMISCEMDVRVGGTWRYVVRAPDGSDHAFSGEYHEIIPLERIVSTERYEPMWEHEYLATMTLEDRGGKTFLRNVLSYKSQDDRDGHVNSGMEPGMRETYQRLDELLAAMSEAQ
ncbi:MAG: SRPBCC family protein [Chloroflexota bacterium]